MNIQYITGLNPSAGLRRTESTSLSVATLHTRIFTFVQNITASITHGIKQRQYRDILLVGLQQTTIYISCSRSRIVQYGKRRERLMLGQQFPIDQRESAVLTMKRTPLLSSTTHA